MSKLRVGILGLPNVGKSTLFNALTRTAAAQAANYPFCTIEPNIGIVEVPDSRLDALADIVKPERILPATVEFVDIAGLVRGASTGEGMGNKFLSHVREADALVEVVRFFQDSDVTHVHGAVHPLSDKETIDAELILADLSTVEKRLARAQSETKSGDKSKQALANFFQTLKTNLEQGQPARLTTFANEDEEIAFHELHLLSAKPILYLANVDESSVSTITPAQVAETLQVSPAEVLILAAKLESELVGLSSTESAEMLKEYGISEPGLASLARSAYHLLGLQSFFTAGVKEVRAWTVHQGATAPQAAGVIHTDFEKGFIRAEVTSFDDFISCGGWSGVKEKGRMRTEGKEYLMQDGDICHFLFNV